MTVSFEIRALSDDTLKARAADLLAAQIPHVNRAQVSPREDSFDHRLVRKVVAELGGRLPADVWLGAWKGRALVGALHAGAPIGQASDVARRVVHGLPGTGYQGWLADYVRRCVNVDELAVVPEHRGAGIGRQLIDALHVAVLSDPDRDVRNVTAHVASASAAAAFRASGYTIGRPSEPVPSLFAEGLPTTWEPMYDTIGGAWAYRHLARRGTSFFR